MKKVISNEELLIKMKEAVNLLCDSVKVTLGPTGNNVLIDADISPFITNDGVTIALAIESEDECVNAILNIAKESAIKTNEIVGDGTTTTLVLLQSIFNKGIKEIENGKNAIVLKNELNEACEEVIKLLKSISKKPTRKDYNSVATIASNSKEIGNVVSSVFLKIKESGGIKVSESINDKTYSEIINGYSFENMNVNELFFKDEKEIVLKNPFIMLINNKLSTLEEISEVINNIILEKRELLIIAESYSEEFINDFILLNVRGALKGILLEIPDYGTNKYEVLKDISVFTNSKIIDMNLEEGIVLSLVNEVRVNKEVTILINDNKNNELVSNRIKKLESEIEKSEDYLKEELKTRILKLKNGIGIIYAGAQTKVERREKKMRIVDSVHAVSTLKSGVLMGGGLSFLMVKDNLEEKNTGFKILKDSLSIPFLQIMENAGLNGKEKLSDIKDKKFKEIYNIKEKKFEKIEVSDIKDPLLVVLTSLKNAVSIAGMLLTTKCLVINDIKANNNYDIIS